MRYYTAGESHGQGLVAIVEDVPAGLKISEEQINVDLARRQAGYGRGGRMKIEHDMVQVISGVRFGRTIGSPVAMLVANRDWANWTERMAPFGEPPLDIYDWMRTDADGRGMVNVLDCVKLVQNPTLYASFLLWMLSELFESLPEAGDLEKPKLVFFFDEAHTLFRDAPAVLVQKIEQTVKLIRSKGVGVFFVTQSPSDIPDTVLAQLSNRVQHALRAYTPAELKAVRVAAQAFRANPAFRAEDAIMELGVGEALTSFLDEQGVPTIVQRTKIVCPQSLMGAPEPMARMKAMLHDGMEKYDDSEDNLSAYEVLTEQADAAALEKQREEDRLAQERLAAEQEKQRAKEETAEEKRRQKLEDEERRRAQKLEDEERRRAQKLEDEARRRAERAAEAEQKKLERQREREAAAAKKKAERLQSKIETQLVSAGGRILRRGLLGILKR